MTLDELIAQGIREILEEDSAELLPESKKHRFSLAYRIARRNTILSCRKRAPLSIRRIKYILLAILFTLFVLLGFGLWRHFGGFSFNVFKDHSKVYYSGENAKAKIKEIYGLPEEYEILAIDINKLNVRTRYKVDEKTVTLNQKLTADVLHTNTENYNAEYISINGYDGYYIIDNNEVNLSWVMDGYQFYLKGKIDKNTAIFLAESIKIRDFDKIP